MSAPRGPWLRRLGLAALATAALATAAPPGRAQGLVADLSDYVIAITVGFTGSRVLLYGATDGEGDVIIVVRGPQTETVVRRKEEMAGVWVNRAEATFAGAPAFYALAASKPVDTLISPAEAARHEIGLDNLNIRPVDLALGADADAFRRALLRRGQSAGVYSDQAAQVRFLGDRLFRTTIEFPANVPTGNYFVHFFLVREGRVVSAQTSALVVTKLGLEAAVFDLAHRRPEIYGLAAVIVAMAAGWLAGALFRRT